MKIITLSIVVHVLSEVYVDITFSRWDIATNVSELGY